MASAEGIYHVAKRMLKMAGSHSSANQTAGFFPMTHVLLIYAMARHIAAGSALHAERKQDR